MKKIFVITMILALVAAMVVPLTVSADNNGTSKISGDVAQAIELTAPGTVSLGSMHIGDNPGSGTDGSVTSNDIAGYKVTVNSNDADGKMVSGLALAPVYTLGTALSVTTGSLSGVVVETAQQPCVGTSTLGTTSIPLSVSQHVDYTDSAVAGYSIVLTYTATLN